MKRAIMGVSAAAAVALAPLCIPAAHADPIDACAGVTDPAANQACIDESLPVDTMRGPQMGDCQSSPDWGQEGQFCRN
jgi:hypothetical protein